MEMQCIFLYFSAFLSAFLTVVMFVLIWVFEKKNIYDDIDYEKSIMVCICSFILFMILTNYLMHLAVKC
jgi:hypothetical protein